MKKFQNITTITAIARARLLARNSAEKNPIGRKEKLENTLKKIGSRIAMIGVRISNPKMLTTENWNNCRPIGFVQHVLQTPILRTTLVALFTNFACSL